MGLLSTLKDKAIEKAVELALGGLSTLALAGMYFFGDLVDTHISPAILTSVSPQFLVRALVSVAVLVAVVSTYFLQMTA